MPYLNIQSHFEVLVIRTKTLISGGDTIQAITVSYYTLVVTANFLKLYQWTLSPVVYESSTNSTSLLTLVIFFVS